jgi:hypothetical protein
MCGRLTSIRFVSRYSCEQTGGRKTAKSQMFVVHMQGCVLSVCCTKAICSEAGNVQEQRRRI